MHVEYVPEDEYESDHSGCALKGIPDVAGMRVGARVGQASLHDHDAHHGVKNEGQKNEAPFNNWQRRTQCMDLIDEPLELLWGSQNAAVGQQVNRHVRTYRNKSC